MEKRYMSIVYSEVYWRKVVVWNMFEGDECASMMRYNPNVEGYTYTWTPTREEAIQALKQKGIHQEATFVSFDQMRELQVRCGCGNLSVLGTKLCEDCHKKLEKMSQDLNEDAYAAFKMDVVPQYMGSREKDRERSKQS